MALIKCSECGREISDKAFACPNCGNPSQNINRITQQVPVMIEQTRKKWKVFQFLGVIIGIIGFYFFIKNLIGGSWKDTGVSFGLFIGFIGLVLFIIGKIGAWWHNR